MATQRITELRRTGGGILEEQPISFEWNSETHSMMQGTLDLTLSVKTNRELPPQAEEPIEQVLGVEWEPFEIGGQWKDKWAGQGFAMTTFEQFSRFVGRTPLVRFQLGRHSLVGIITRLRTQYLTDAEVAWSITFSPHNNETVGNFRRTAPNETVIKPTAQRVAEIEDTVSVLELQMQIANSIPSTTSDVDDAFDEMLELSESVRKVSEAADAVSTESTDSSTLIGSADRAVTKLMGLAASFRQVRGVADTNLLAIQERTSDVIVAYDDVLATLKCEEWLRSNQLGLVRLQGSVRAGEADALSRAAKRPQAVHRASNGESLERISIRYYGTPDNWRAIYDANNLGSLQLTAGQELLIPERR